MLQTQTSAEFRAHRESSNPPAEELRKIICVERRVSIKEIASHPAVQMSDDSVERWVNGSRDVPARKLPGLYYALSRYQGIWSCLLDYTDLIVVPKPLIVAPHSMPYLLASFSHSIAVIYDIFSRVLRKERFSQEQLRRLREEGEKAKRDIDESVAWYERELRGQEEKK
jgi:hypothetical protein